MDKKFIVIDRDEDTRGSHETKGEAVERAREVISGQPSYGPCIIYQAVTMVKKAQEPVQVVDI